jgi:hypothetical protein
MFEKHLGKSASARSRLQDKPFLGLRQVPPEAAAQPGFGKIDSGMGVELSFGKPVPLIAKVGCVILRRNESGNSIYDGVGMVLSDELIVLVVKGRTSLWISQRGEIAVHFRLFRPHSPIES